MSSRFICVVECIRTSFLSSLNSTHLCLFYILFFYSSVDGHVGCFYLLAILNNATVSICVQESVLVCFHIFGSTWICWVIAMAPHSSTLAWKIPWTEELGRLQSMGSRKVGHDWATSLSLVTFMRWRRKWQPTPVFLRGESQGQGSLVGCRLWGRTESDTTEAT